MKYLCIAYKTSCFILVHTIACIHHIETVTIHLTPTFKSYDYKKNDILYYPLFKLSKGIIKCFFDILYLATE